jgi:hypothetical protein
MNHVHPLGLVGVMYIRLMTVGPDIKLVLLRLLPQ